MNAGIRSIIVRSSVRSCASAVARSWRCESGSFEGGADTDQRRAVIGTFWYHQPRQALQLLQPGVTAIPVETEARGGVVRRSSRPLGQSRPQRRSARPGGRRADLADAAAPLNGKLLPRSFRIGRRLASGLVALGHGRIGRRIPESTAASGWSSPSRDSSIRTCRDSHRRWRRQLENTMVVSAAASAWEILPSRLVSSVSKLAPA